MNVQFVINNQLDFFTYHGQTVKMFFALFFALNTERHCAGTGEGCGGRAPYTIRDRLWDWRKSVKNFGGLVV